MTEPSGLVTEYTYDALGRQITETEVTPTPTRRGVTTTFTYDALSRLVSVTGPVTTDAVTGTQHQLLTHQRPTTPTATSSRSRSSDLLGGDPTRIDHHRVRRANRPIRVVDAEGNETSYGYDRFGNRDVHGGRQRQPVRLRLHRAATRWPRCGCGTGTSDPQGAPGDRRVPGAELLLLRLRRPAGERRPTRWAAACEYTVLRRRPALRKIVLKNFREPGRHAPATTCWRRTSTTTPATSTGRSTGNGTMTVDPDLRPRR